MRLQRRKLFPVSVLNVLRESPEEGQAIASLISIVSSPDGKRFRIYFFLATTKGCPALTQPRVPLER